VASVSGKDYVFWATDGSEHAFGAVPLLLTMTCL
jgi:hypothetical protein